MKLIPIDGGFEIPIGGMWEDSKWEIKKDVKITGTHTRCLHCGPQQHTEEDGNFFICPFVVEAVNEGGYNSTGVCLNCILEAAELLKRLPFTA